MKKLLGGSLAPVVAGVVIAAVWEALLRLTDPDGFVLPAPTEIAMALYETRSSVVDAALNTGFVIVTGLIGGVVVGSVAALLVTRWRAAAETITPLAVAINAIPIIALAPIFNAWFGLLSPRSNQMIVVALVSFPVFINTTRGLTNVERSQLELMSSYAASTWRVTRDVRIPNALPYFFSALRLASSLAVIAAIVAEYFGGRQDALGPIVTQNAALARYSDAWAAVLAGSLIGALLYGIVVVIERRTIPWHSLQRQHA